MVIVSTLAIRLSQLEAPQYIITQRNQKHEAAMQNFLGIKHTKVLHFKQHSSQKSEKLLFNNIYY